MKPSRIVVLLGLMLVGLLAAACGGAASPSAGVEPDRVATRVAEDLAVAATLTALTPPKDQPTASAPAEVTVAAAEVTFTAAPPTVTEAPASTAEPTTAPTEAPPAASCRVVTAGLNLRPGPGTVYAPPLAGLGRNTELRPLTFVGRGFPAGQWIEVQVVSTGALGWVSAGQQFVACNVDFASLPAGVPPPTPTPAPTPAVTQTPASQVVVIPVDGSDGNKSLGNNRGVNSGRSLLLPGFASYEVSDPMVFRDRIVFRAEVFDRGVGETDGAGIEEVTFVIRDENGNKVHERIERNAGYCAFGGGEPDCVVWRFAEHGNKWPDGTSVQPGVHDVQIQIKPKRGEAVAWFWSFRIEQ